MQIRILHRVVSLDVIPKRYPKIIWKNTCISLFFYVQNSARPQKHLLYMIAKYFIQNSGDGCFKLNAIAKFLANKSPERLGVNWLNVYYYIIWYHILLLNILNSHDITIKNTSIFLNKSFVILNFSTNDTEYVLHLYFLSECQYSRNDMVLVLRYFINYEGVGHLDVVGHFYSLCTFRHGHFDT